MELSRELGRTVKALEDMPKLLQHLEVYLEAFDMLAGSRPLGFGTVGAIPLSEILTCIAWEGVQGKSEQRRWIRYIQALDNVYLQEVRDKQDD